jgi:hypothetical protein
MVRADVAVVPVSWALVPGTKTALIRLEQFSAGAADAIKAALTDIKAAGADRLVLDLRGDPGGHRGRRGREPVPGAGRSSSAPQTATRRSLVAPGGLGTTRRWSSRRRRHG